MAPAYSSAELLTINAARLLRDGDVVFVGCLTWPATWPGELTLRTW
jgi:hypothetical protein